MVEAAVRASRPGPFRLRCPDLLISTIRPQATHTPAGGLRGMLGIANCE
jgi:hypothetical protein